MTRRTLFLLLALAAVGTAVAFQFGESFDDAKVFRPIDFMEYQTAGQATLNRENPYDGAVLYRYQREIQARLPDKFEGGPGGVTKYDDPIMMWNPPWCCRSRCRSGRCTGGSGNCSGPPPSW